MYSRHSIKQTIIEQVEGRNVRFVGNRNLFRIVDVTCVTTRGHLMTHHSIRPGAKCSVSFEPAPDGSFILKQLHLLEPVQPATRRIVRQPSVKTATRKV